MRFDIRQQFAADADAVARAYADPELYLALGALPKVSMPEIVAHDADGDVVHLHVRHRFDGELSAAARAVIDPTRLTWVEQATHDLAARRTTFTMVPDHYRDRFRCQGSYSFEPTGDAACRRDGVVELTVKAFLVAGAVEGAIISGLKEHLADEPPVVEAFVRDRA